jgi:hypothetical protein
MLDTAVGYQPYQQTRAATAGPDIVAEVSPPQAVGGLPADLTALIPAINAILLTWATVLDARHTSALARTLGATPQQVSAGLSAAQVLPALAGALLGIPGGFGLYSAVNKDGGPVTLPPVWWLPATRPQG